MQTVLEAIAMQMTFISNNLMRHVDGLTHEDSLLQLPFRGNCLNWVVGHIVASRNNILKMLGAEQFWTEEEAARYMRGSDPITPENAHLAYRLEDLLATYERSQPLLTAAILGLTEEGLAKPWRDNDVNHWLVRYAQHEAYHVGQTEILRQLTGKNDAV